MSNWKVEEHSKINPRKSQTADTRTCDWSKVAKDTLLESTHNHIHDVRDGFDLIKKRIDQQARNHDRTKLTHIDEFHEDFKTGFKNKSWWEMHQRKERHHFKNSECIPADVDLVDILDQIIDGIMAGMARSGEYRQEPMPPELLQRAYENTVKYVLKHVEVKS